MKNLKSKKTLKHRIGNIETTFANSPWIEIIQCKYWRWLLFRSLYWSGGIRHLEKKEKNFNFVSLKFVKTCFCKARIVFKFYLTCVSWHYMSKKYLYRIFMHGSDLTKTRYHNNIFERFSARAHARNCVIT